MFLRYTVKTVKSAVKLEYIFSYIYINVYIITHWFRFHTRCTKTQPDERQQSAAAYTGKNDTYENNTLARCNLAYTDNSRPHEGYAKTIIHIVV